jgi:hypothetical protein
MSSPTPASVIVNDEKRRSDSFEAPPPTFTTEEKKSDPTPSSPKPESTTPKHTKEHTRTESADSSLTPKQKVKLAKSERQYIITHKHCPLMLKPSLVVQELRRQSKLLKEEEKAEKQALTTSERELAGLKKVHATAIKVCAPLLHI